MKKSELREVRQRLTEQLWACGPGRGTLDIEWIEGKATPTGRSDYFRVRLWTIEQQRSDHKNPNAKSTLRPSSINLTRNVARALGFRFNERRECVLLTGCGYSKSYELAQGLAKLAGHAIHTEGEHGWVHP